MMAADLPMQDVRAQYAELKATLSTFQASVGDCLERAEAEFLQAYRAHMVEVHRELQQLRAQLGEPPRRRSVTTTASGSSRRAGAWYRGEAAQQAAHVAALRKDRTYARRKRRALDADRRHLRRQLEAGKREQKRRGARAAATTRTPSPQADAERAVRPPPRRCVPGDFGKAATQHDTTTPTGRLRADVERLRGRRRGAHGRRGAAPRHSRGRARPRRRLRDLYASCAAAGARGGTERRPRVWHRRRA